MRLKWSIAVLWTVCSFAFWLTSYRPFTGSSGLAASIPAQLGPFEMTHDHGITDRMASLLGTDDAIWRTYAGRDGVPIYVVLVCHRENWKSVHPPDICLRGSNMIITSDSQLDTEGRLTLFNETNQLGYMSLYRYGADGLATGSYSNFFLFHAPRALFRASTVGYLLRVETDYARGGEAEAEARCKALIDAMEPSLARIVR